MTDTPTTNSQPAVSEASGGTLTDAAPDASELVWRSTLALPWRLSDALDEVQHPQDRMGDRVARRLEVRA